MLEGEVFGGMGRWFWGEVGMGEGLSEGGYLDAGVGGTSHVILSY